jgi:ketosteroid isomerase-like protein
MKYMKRRGLKLFAVAALLPSISWAQGTVAPAAQAVAVSPSDTAVVRQLTQMVRDFLADVPKGDRATFDTFFADDVIYTRSSGVTVDKAEILKNIGVRAATQPQATFEADGFTVHAYGDAAVVNFRLVMHDLVNGKPATVYFRNTGSFLKRQGKWQVVAWQATRVPETTEAKP